MNESNGYPNLEQRPGKYRQLYIKGRKLSAERLYRETIGEDARSPEQLAHDFDVPLPAVLEAIDYCIHNQELLRREGEQRMAEAAEFDRRHPPLLPPAHLQE